MLTAKAWLFGQINRLLQPSRRLMSLASNLFLLASSLWQCPEPLTRVASGCDVGAPRAMGEIPVHGFFEAGGKVFARAPAKFALELCAIDGVTAVVAWPV